VKRRSRRQRRSRNRRRRRHRRIPASHRLFMPRGCLLRQPTRCSPAIRRTRFGSGLGFGGALQPLL